MNQQTTEFVHTEFDQQYHKIDHLHNDNESFLGSGSQRHISQPLHLITSDDKVSHKELDKHEEQLFDKYTLKRTNSDSAKSANFKQTKILSPKNEKSQESFSQIVHFESEFGLGKKHQDHLGLMHSKNEKRSHLKINYNNLVEDKKINAQLVIYEKYFQESQTLIMGKKICSQDDISIEKKLVSLVLRQKGILSYSQ